MFGKLKDKMEETLEKGKNLASDTIDGVSELADKAETLAKGVADDFSDSYIDSNLSEDGKETFCSWCFEKATCTLKEKNNFSRNVYLCDKCDHEIVKCRACDNKAKFSTISLKGGADNGTKTDNENKKEKEIGVWSGNFCAVHEGTIAKFETLTWKLGSIGEYRDIVERKEANYKKIGTTAAYSIGGAAVIAPLALAAAPAIGGAVGTSLLGYSGAAATNAGLATLGGGAIAAGGAGMAGGVAIVTATGTALGGRYGAVISNSYYGDIDGFEIVRVKPGIQPTIICIDGFLSEDDKEAPEAWLKGIYKKYPDNEVYHVRWESKRLRDLASSVSFLSGKQAVKSGVFSAAMSASKAAAGKIAPLGAAFQALGLATNPWSVASLKAYQTGALLADIIARTDKEYILVGHSLGSRVIYSCLSALSKSQNYINTVHLLGGAVNNTCDEDAKEDSVNWLELHKCVSGNIINYYSENDSVLKWLYTAGEALRLEIGDPIGRNKISCDRIINVDVSEYIDGHTEYKGNIEKVFDSADKQIAEKIKMSSS